MFLDTIPSHHSKLSGMAPLSLQTFNFGPLLLADFHLSTQGLGQIKAEGLAQCMQVVLHSTTAGTLTDLQPNTKL